MNKRILAALLAVLILLSGCQLAKPDTDNTIIDDRLVGVFVTTEHLDLWDAEAFLDEHLDDILAGNSIIDRPQQQNKLYARLVEESADGSKRPVYVFEGVDGIVLASYLIQPQDSQSSEYWSAEVTEGICDVSFGHHAKDEGHETTLTGTIYMEEGAAEQVFYFNPIYQTADGQVYLVPGDGMSFDGGLSSSATHRSNAEHTQTEDGRSMSYRCEIAITMETVIPAHQVKVYHMNSDHQILHVDEYPSERLPDSLSPVQNTSYLLVEEHTADGSIRRALYQSGDSSIDYFLSWKNHICIKKQVTLQWPQ